MIINAILSLVSSLLGLLLSPLHIPDLPDGLASAISSVFGHVTDGLAIVAAFTHWNFICALFWAAVAIEGAMLVYKFIMWIIKKIPLSME